MDYHQKGRMHPENENRTITRESRAMQSKIPSPHATSSKFGALIRYLVVYPSLSTPTPLGLEFKSQRGPRTLFSAPNALHIHQPVHGLVPAGLLHLDTRKYHLIGVPNVVTVD